MVRRQRVKSGPKTSQLILRCPDAEKAAVLLNHIDSGPAVACIDHELHPAVGRKDGPQRSKADIRVSQVMQHSCANHEVERATNFLDPLDRELMEFEILQIVLALKIARVAQARLADVD